MELLTAKSVYLIGIKGVAMTALAQCLAEAGIQVRGCDVAEEFVTQPMLNRLGVVVDTGFEQVLPSDIEAVVYTAAHQGPANPLVKQAQQQGLPTWSHAEALGHLFNAKHGIAVCGVGGKSTTSAMIAWVLEKVGKKPSFAIGVGNIIGLNKTGQWSSDSPYFVAEADEYVVDPAAPSRQEAITPRFSFLKPHLTVCTNLRFDHPDVYRDFDHTLEVFQTFFAQLPTDGLLVVNSDDRPHIEMMLRREPQLKAQIVYYGQGSNAVFELTQCQVIRGVSAGMLTYQGQNYPLRLQLPGKYNMMNAVAAVAACHQLGLSISDIVDALATFRSTQRRAEFKGEKAGVRYYDDYAHHPHEVAEVIKAYKEWFPDQKLVVAFQSHTFSRTKALFDEFVTAFEQADQVVMTDIFPSAREQFDDTISSDTLCQAIRERYPQSKVENLKTNAAVVAFCRTQLAAGDVVLTLGAGDIYQIHDQLYPTEWAKELAEVFPDIEWRFSVPMASVTYFKIGGPADVLAEVSQAEQLGQIWAWSQRRVIPITMLGGASNVIVADEGIRGIVIRLANSGVELTDTYVDEKRVIRAGAGTRMGLLVRQAIDWKLAGLEYFLGVPGTLGGAVVNNAHYLADLIGSHIHRVQVLDKQFQLTWLDQSECDFAYDHSRFQTSGEVVVAVEFALPPGDPQTSAELVKKATQYRATTQPLGEPSSGCIFQNVPNTPELKKLFPQFVDREHISGGFLIDQAGLKGEHCGPIEVSHKHAAFMINKGGGTAAQVKELIALVKARVKERFQVELQEEVFYLG